MASMPDELNLADTSGGNAGSSRTLKAAGPPRWRYAWRMSGVFANRFGRMYSRTPVCVSSVKYSVSSGFVFRQVKYVYDCVNPMRPSSCIIAGRVNASARKRMSGSVLLTSAMMRSQKLMGLVCGLSTRKMRTPCDVQCRMTRRTSW